MLGIMRLLARTRKEYWQTVFQALRYAKRDVVLMVTSVSIIQINRPPEEVFEFITDPANARVWHLEIEAIEGTKGLPTGSTGRMITRIMGQPVESRYEVIENDGRSVVRVKSTQGPIRFETMQSVNQDSQGMTELRFETKIDAGTIFRLAEPVLESLVSASIDADLRTLKVAMEHLAASS